MIHMDFMVGSDDLHIVGIGKMAVKWIFLWMGYGLSKLGEHAI